MSKPRWFSLAFLRRVVASLAIYCAAVMVPHTAFAREAYEPEAVKAAFLFHFGAFVDWPHEPKGPDEFRIAVLGARDVLEELMRIAPERSVRGRQLAVRAVQRPEGIGEAHIVFVGAEHAALLPRVAQLTRSRPTLIVTDAPDGLAQGAAINFVIRDERVRFAVSIPAAQRAGLSISSRLLNVALHVEKTGLRLDGEPPQLAFTRWIRLALRGGPRAAAS